MHGGEREEQKETDFTIRDLFWSLIVKSVLRMGFEKSRE